MCSIKLRVLGKTVSIYNECVHRKRRVLDETVSIV
jgi:hypothetical protein